MILYEACLQMQQTIIKANQRTLCQRLVIRSQHNVKGSRYFDYHHNSTEMKETTVKSQTTKESYWKHCSTSLPPSLFTSSLKNSSWFNDPIFAATCVMLHNICELHGESCEDE